MFRINKGILDVTRDKELNQYTPEDRRRVPFRNMTDEEELSMKKELESIDFFSRCNKF